MYCFLLSHRIDFHRFPKTFVAANLILAGIVLARGVTSPSFVSLTPQETASIFGGDCFQLLGIPCAPSDGFSCVDDNSACNGGVNGGPCTAWGIVNLNQTSIVVALDTDDAVGQSNFNDGIAPYTPCSQSCQCYLCINNMPNLPPLVCVPQPPGLPATCDPTNWPELDTIFGPTCNSEGLIGATEKLRYPRSLASAMRFNLFDMFK